MEHNLMVFIGSLMNIFVIDREVRIFFDKKRTPLAVYALSFLFFVVLMNAVSLLAIPRGSLLVGFAARIVILLNYEGSWKKRIVAAISLMAIVVAIEIGVMLLFGIYFASFFDGEVVHNALTMTVTSLVRFITALALQRLKHLKKDVISSPVVLVFLFIIPLSSVILLIFLAVTTRPTPFGAVLISAIIFGINVIVFYLARRYIPKKYPPGDHDIVARIICQAFSQILMQKKQPLCNILTDPMFAPKINKIIIK